MKYFYLDINVIENTLSEEVLKKQLASHLHHLDSFFDRKALLIGGSKITNRGGFVIAAFASEKEAVKFYQTDPMYKAGYLDVTITPFDIYRENTNGWVIK